VSRYDYEMSKMISSNDPPFPSLIMAALRKADTGNADRLRVAFPAICSEMEQRYNAPGGVLPGDPS
jgi:hypothetical protein